MDTFPKIAKQYSPLIAKAHQAGRRDLASKLLERGAKWNAYHSEQLTHENQQFEIE
jgi:hypothetical protein